MESSSEDDNEIIIIAGAAVAVLRAVVAEEENNRVSDKGMKWTWPQQYNILISAMMLLYSPALNNCCT